MLNALVDLDQVSTHTAYFHHYSGSSSATTRILNVFIMTLSEFTLV